MVGGGLLNVATILVRAFIDFGTRYSAPVTYFCFLSTSLNEQHSNQAHTLGHQRTAYIRWRTWGIEIESRECQHGYTHSPSRSLSLRFTLLISPHLMSHYRRIVVDWVCLCCQLGNMIQLT
ncbi:uncharacterized protein YALI1_E30074g [Yarrowia lipolytica]|uniref:Uncharacterized protein n=1 Tax=Yarrowia lipolytica TaxID=4952 RepID=A0A1D8NK12_YARLL|nr:hypothetical protein YALI1_E30074g [Yarrowia lipolytica]